jgi:hypothetical protein
MDPDFPHSTMIVHAYEQKGMFAEILAEIEKNRRSTGDAPWLCSEEAYVYGRTGQGDRARLALAKLEKWNRRQPVDYSSVCRALHCPGREGPGFLLAGKSLRATFERLDVAEGRSDVRPAAERSALSGLDA